MSFWYFPCLPGSKEPALPGNWRSHATQDTAVIDGWLDAGYNLALDCERSGITVVDLDPGSVRPDGLTPTFERPTPRGGSHIYYAGACKGAGRKNLLGPHVDTRGVGGYVLVDPSVIDARSGKPADYWGTYGDGNGLPIAPVPGWIRERLATVETTTRAVVADLDLPNSITRATLWLQQRAPAIEGQGGDTWTYQTAVAALDLGLSGERALALMLEHWNPRCEPPWAEDELQIKIENAVNYQQNEAGSWAVAPAETRFAGYLDSHPPEAGGGDVSNPYKLWRVDEALARPPPKWIMPGTIPREVLLLLFGLPEAGKSWIALDLCLHVASGLAGWGREESEPEDVIFFCGEGFADLAHNRIVAWCRAKGVPVEEIAGRLRLLENFPSLTENDQIRMLADAINTEHLKPALIVLDTYARVMAESGLGENDPKEVMKFVHEAERIKRGFRCTVIPIHHSGKDTERGARGSNSLIAAVDVAWEMNAHWETRAFELSCAKMKIAQKPAPLHFEAKDAAPGLVFNPIDHATYKALTVAHDALGLAEVSRSLQQMGAVGHDHAVTTHALASHLYQGPQDEKPEDTIAARDRLSRQLNAGAKRQLGAYAERASMGWMWSLPA